MTRNKRYLIAVVVGLVIGILIVVTYVNSAHYRDETFSNEVGKNQQQPEQLDGYCFGGTDILTAEVVRETHKSLLLEVSYCNDAEEKMVLGLRSREAERLPWAFTPGGTVLGHGKSLVRLQVGDFNGPITIDEYEIYLYGNSSGREYVSTPFYFEKTWCFDRACPEPKAKVQEG